jgi:superoxide dismutase
MEYKLPELPYPNNALASHISTETIEQYTNFRQLK